MQNIYQNQNGAVQITATKMEHSMFMDYMLALYIVNPVHGTLYCLRQKIAGSVGAHQADYDNAVQWLNSTGPADVAAKIWA